MNQVEQFDGRYHEDSDRFRETLGYTERETALSARLIEKDYYCSLILRDYADVLGSEMVFKGGTCLSKVYAEFYRLSEDLDFAIPMAADASRAARRQRIEPVKKWFAGLPERIPCFEVTEELRGHRNSTQYIGTFGYHSALADAIGTIKVEIGLREPIIQAVEEKPALTLLIDPLRSQAVVPPMHLSVMSLKETYAEKFRAALTRLDPAIRDFYDISHAIELDIIDPTDEDLLKLIELKLAIPGNDPVDISNEKMNALRRQLEPQLKPVLRAENYETFDLEQSYSTVKQVIERLQ